MNKDTILKVAGVVFVVAGSVCLYLSGQSAEAVSAVVGAVFVLAGLIAGFFFVKKS